MVGSLTKFNVESEQRCCYSIPMEIEFDPSKNAQNIAERGLSFTLAEKFVWATSLILEDVRQEYGEPRFRAFGYINHRLFVMIFTPRGNTLRIISLRKANRRERNWYEAQTQS